MALMITPDCINCGVCDIECPNQAITPLEDICVIDPDKCTECVGYHEKSQCIEVCPADCILPDPKRIENKVQLREKFQRLAA